VPRVLYTTKNHLFDLHSSTGVSMSSLSLMESIYFCSFSYGFYLLLFSFLQIFLNKTPLSSQSSLKTHSCYSHSAMKINMTISFCENTEVPYTCNDVTMHSSHLASVTTFWMKYFSFHFSQFVDLTTINWTIPWHTKDNNFILYNFLPLTLYLCHDMIFSSDTNPTTIMINICLNTDSGKIIQLCNC
jgi:hypothetical protein